MENLTQEQVYGFTGNLLRVDLTSGKITTEKLNMSVVRRYLGGAALGIKLLYDEVPVGASWSDADNRFIIATGPLTGTMIGGTGMFAVVTKGALTNGAVHAQASGFLGAYLRFCGYDVIVVQGKAENPTYLYIYEGGAELRDASRLMGKDTWETERLVKEDLGTGEHQSSVYGIGPAGENLVRFACLVGDKGHVAAHNGVGAVLGSKNLKAIAVARGKRKVILKDRDLFSTLAKKMYENATGPQAKYGSIATWGTTGTNSAAEGRMRVSRLPIKNQTTNLWAPGDKFSEETIRSQPYFEMKRTPCWACRFTHCQSIKITEGPYAGYEGDEPEYEGWAGFGPLIGNEDWAGMAVLSNDADRLGVDVNEASWLVAWVMEVYEKGLFKKELLDGLEMNWGNVEAARELLRNVAWRKGIGDILAEGMKRSAEHFGGDSQMLAVYTGKGNTPRMHDHRATWAMIMDTVTSDRGRDADVALIFNASSVGLPAELDLFTPEGAARALAKVRGRNTFSDCLLICRFNIAGSDEDIVELLNAATGWGVSTEDMQQVSRRFIHLSRLFNLRHGLTAEMEYPSARYGSAPLDGANFGKTINPVWKEALTRYYELMGWDRGTGMPLPETLDGVGLPDNEAMILHP